MMPRLIKEWRVVNDNGYAGLPFDSYSDVEKELLRVSKNDPLVKHRLEWRESTPWVDYN